MTNLTILCDPEPALRAIDSLAELAKRSPQAVAGFLESVGDDAQLVRIDPDRRFAPRADEARFVFEPSDLLRDFLAAARAGDVDGEGVQ